MGEGFPEFVQLASVQLPRIEGQFITPYTLARSSDGVTIALGQTLTCTIHCWGKQGKRGGGVGVAFKIVIDWSMLRGPPKVKANQERNILLAIKFLLGCCLAEIADGEPEQHV